MSCLEPRTLESLVAGTLSVEQESIANSHLGDCSECRRKTDFLAALRLSLTQQHPSPQPGPDCPSDESLAAYLDDAVPLEEREQIQTHLLDCGSCLAGLAAVQRALTEADQEPVQPPIQLLNQAIRIGAPGRSAASAVRGSAGGQSLLDRLFGASLGWRLGLAGTVAGLVLLLTVLVSNPPGDRPAGPIGDDSDPSGPKVAEGPGPRPQDADPGVLAPGAGRPDSPVAVPDDRPDTMPAKVADAPDPTAGPKAPAEQPWMASMTPAARFSLAARLQTDLLPARVDLGKALTESQGDPSFPDAYVLGRAIGFLERFQNHVGESKELGNLVADTLLSLEPALRTAMRAAPATDRLISFANELGQKIANGQIEPDKAGRRLKVFTTAVREAVGANDRSLGAFRLGTLVQGWQTNATAGNQGAKVSKLDPDSLERAKKIIHSAPGLSDRLRTVILDDLSNIDRLGSQGPAVDRAGRILNEIDSMDKVIRSTR